MLWISRTRGTLHRRRVRELARDGVLARSARRGRRRRVSGSARSTAASTASAAACPWPTAASGETPITTSAKWRPAAERIRSRRSSTGGLDRRDRLPRRLLGVGRRAVHQHVDVPPHQPRALRASTSTATKSAATESPPSEPARASDQADEHGDASRRGRCRSAARSRQRRAAGNAAPRATRRACAPMSIDEHERRSTRTRTSAGRPATCDPAGEPRDRQRTAIADADAARATPPRTAPRGARPCRARTGGAGRRAGPRRRARRTSAAPRRGRCPSGSASETRPAASAREAAVELQRDQRRRRADARQRSRPLRVSRVTRAYACGYRLPRERLLALDRLEQRLEVALAEARARRGAGSPRRRRVGRSCAGLGEDLQQVAVLVAVDQDPEPLQVVPRLVDLADAVGASS